MTPEQEQKIVQLDKLKADGTLTPEEYDRAKARVLTPPAPAPTPAPVLATETKGAIRPEAIFVGLALLVVIVISIIIFNGKHTNPPPAKNDYGYNPDTNAVDESMYTDSGGVAPEPETSTTNDVVGTAFNPDIAQNQYLLVIKNRNPFDYNGCELKINDRFKADVPHIKPGGNFIVAHRSLADEEGNLYNSETTRIQELEFYCKDYNGHSDLISLERK